MKRALPLLAVAILVAAIFWVCTPQTTQAQYPPGQNTNLNTLESHSINCTCADHTVDLDNRTFGVYATREGLIGRLTATGYRIRSADLFVALPDRSALGKMVKITYKDKSYTVPVRDVGPWNTIDDYWNHRDPTPAAQLGQRIGPMAKYGKPTNPAGIDISDGLWAKLGLTKRTGQIQVQWEFADPD